MTVTEKPVRPWKDWVGLVCRLVLGGVMLAAGIPKAMNIAESQQATRAYQLLPYELANAWGMVMPFVEVVIGVLLIIGLKTRLAAIIGALLMLAFVIGIVSVWARGIKIDCGCFGGGGPVDDPKYGQELLRDGALLLTALWLAIRPRTTFSLDARLFG